VFSVYRLSDPAEPWHYRYVGKGKNPEGRCMAHIRHALNISAKTTHKVNWLRTLLFAKPFRYPIIEVIESVETEKEAFEFEKYYIEKYRAEGHRLTNLTNGGEGMSGWVPSSETRAKMSAALRDNTHLSGHKHSEETLVKMSAAHKGQKAWNKGKRHSAETLAKLSAASKGRKHSAETLIKMSTAIKKAYENPEYRTKQSAAAKGNTNWLGKKHSDNTRAKLSIAAKNMSNETRAKLRAAALKQHNVTAEDLKSSIAKMKAQLEILC